MASFRLAASCLLFVTFVLRARSNVIRSNEYETSEEPVQVYGAQWEDEDDPSAMLAYIHSPNEKELTIHQLSRNLLIVTKDLLSYEPRTKSPGRYLGTDEKLSLLRTLKPEDVKNLLSHHSISVPPTSNLSCGANELYYRTMDGSCNNLLNPCWGKTDEPYARWLPPAYANGLDEPRKMKSGHPLPNPRLINRWVSSQLEPSAETTYTSFTNLLVVWGQMIAHEVLLTPTVTIKVWNGTDFKNERPQCCKTANPHPECCPIVMNYEDGYYPSGHCMNIVRSSAYMYSPYSCSSLKLGKTREQMNQLTSFIDASIVYGVTEEEMRKLRENGGLGAKLVMDHLSGWSYPTRKEGSKCKASSNSCNKKCFLTGEKRANENPVLSAMHTLFAREHNRLVDLLRIKGWPEETLFHVVRKIVGAMLQHTTYKEYLPLVVGPTLSSVMKLNVPTENYKYDPSINPTLYNAFVTAAFRYGHSMVSTRHDRAGTALQDSPVLSKDFFSMDDFCNPQSDSISDLLNGQIRQKVQKVDCLFSKQITNHLFAKEVNGKGLDLFSVNVQRGRDHGIPPYNEWRKVCGLPAATDYADLKGIIPDYIVDRLEQVYGPGNVHEIDLYVGGIAEFPVNDGILGPTFTCIVANQFHNLKLGDRFWYENLRHPGAFNQAQITSIQKTTIASLICRNTDTREIPQLALILESVYNPKVSCKSIMQQTDLDFQLW